jgi:DNA-binding NarL/FixJ family response regulator
VTVRVVIADDHPMFREGLAALFEAMPDVDVVAECSSGAEAIEAAAAHQPDVVLMDLQMPGMSGIDATRQIVGTSPHIGVLVVTMFDADESVFAAMKAGARGYVLKGAGHDEILRAVRTVAAGEAIFGSALAKRLIGYFSVAGGAGAVPFGNLTSREREVLDKVAAGRSNTGIARDLGLSEKTVRNHLSNIFVKLQVADRAQAIVRAREAGLGRESAPPAPR